MPSGWFPWELGVIHHNSHCAATAQGCWCITVRSYTRLMQTQWGRWHLWWICLKTELSYAALHYYQCEWIKIRVPQASAQRAAWYWIAHVCKQGVAAEVSEASKVTCFYFLESTDLSDLHTDNVHVHVCACMQYMHACNVCMLVCVHVCIKWHYVHHKSQVCACFK